MEKMTEGYCRVCGRVMSKWLKGRVEHPQCAEAFAKGRESMRAEIVKLTDQRNYYASKVYGFDEELAKLRSQLAEKDAQRNYYASKVYGFDEELAKLRSQLAEKDAKMERLKKAAKSLMEMNGAEYADENLRVNIETIQKLEKKLHALRLALTTSESKGKP